MYEDLVFLLRKKYDKAPLVIAAADALEEIKKHKWIPVNIRYPDIMDSVIISGRMKYKWETQFTYFVDVAMYTGDKKFETFIDWYEGQDEFEVTHWMPLPEPIED